MCTCNRQRFRFFFFESATYREGKKYSFRFFRTVSFDQVIFYGYQFYFSEFLFFSEYVINYRLLVLLFRIYKAIMNKIDNRDFVTFVLMNVKRSVRHRPKKEIASKKTERKGRGNVGPPDTSITVRREGATVHLYGDSNVAAKWINGHFAIGKKVLR